MVLDAYAATLLHADATIWQQIIVVVEVSDELVSAH